MVRNTKRDTSIYLSCNNFQLAFLRCFVAKLRILSKNPTVVIPPAMSCILSEVGYFRTKTIATLKITRLKM